MLHQGKGAVHGVNQFTPAGAVEKQLTQDRASAVDTAQNQAAVLIQVINLGYGFADDIIRLEIVDPGLGLVVKYDATGLIGDHHALIKIGKYG